MTSSPQPPVTRYPDEVISETPVAVPPEKIPRRICSPRRVRAVRSLRRALSGISSTYRRRIRQRFLGAVGSYRPLNDELRATVADAIFEVENDLEHRQRQHPQVAIMRAARNRLYDDLGWNEYRKARRPASEGVGT
jgi:hypothetical protein